jgi:hypothetical protein
MLKANHHHQPKMTPFDSSEPITDGTLVRIWSDYEKAWGNPSQRVVGAPFLNDAGQWMVRLASPGGHLELWPTPLARLLGVPELHDSDGRRRSGVFL